MARLGGAFDDPVHVCQKKEYIEGIRDQRKTFYNAVLGIFLSARGGSVEVVSRGSWLVYDRSASAD